MNYSNNFYGNILYKSYLSYKDYSFLITTINKMNLENFELKAYRRSNSGEDFLKPYFVQVLNQTDTYFTTLHPQRLKLREEEKRNYIIRYDRENQAKERICTYDFFPVDDIILFKKVFCDR